MQTGKLLCALVILAAVGGATQAGAKVIEDKSGSLKTLTSIGDALDSPGRRPVHILYVHGIHRVGAGDSEQLRESICTKLKLCAVSDWKNAGVEFADKGEFSNSIQPPALTYLGNPIWKNAEEWRAAAPFVVHWVVHLRHHSATLILDEINWWPLVLALKCRRIEANEAYLAGPDRDLLQVCSQQSKQDPDELGRFYPWITAEQAKKLAAIQPHAVLINRLLKDNLIDWGLSDVVLVVGQMGDILRDALRQLMAKSAAFDPNEAGASSGGNGAVGKYDWKAQLSRGAAMDQEFIGVTHSLGSYLLFNTLNSDFAGVPAQNLSASEAARKTDEENAIHYIFERTSLVYFFANQLEMLEITNLGTASNAAGEAKQPAGSGTGQAMAAPAANFRALVHEWEQLQANFQTALHPNDEAAREKIQVVAWSDPSDVLTWRAPRIGDVDVVNLYVQNAVHWLWIFESPPSAHRNYAANKDVLRVMFEDTAHPAAGN